LKDNAGMRILKKGLRWKKLTILFSSPNGSTGSPLQGYNRFMRTVYILLCDDKTYYVGITTDLSNRLFQHRNGDSFYTKRFKQLDLVYREELANQIEAEKRERQIKKWSRAKNCRRESMSRNQGVLYKHYG